MKKILLLAILVISFVSCEDNSPKGKIEKAFREYVKKNFDDPKSLKEITDIEIGTDTINVCKLREALREEINLAYSIDSVCYFAMKAVMGSQHLSKNRAERDKEYREELMSMLKSMIDYTSFKEDNKIDLSLTRKNFDSIFRLDTIVVNDKIKCRVNKGGELRLEIYESHRNTSFTNIGIAKEGASAQDVYDFYEESNKYIDLSKKLSKQIKLGKEALYKFSQMEF